MTNNWGNKNYNPEKWDLSKNKIGTKHGMCYHQDYNIWSNMKARCYNPNSGKYYMYGAKGVTVCDNWLYSFENFINDMGPRPTPSHSIDRIDGSGNYEPLNCRWATKLEQANNLKSTKMLTLRNKTQSQAAWARELKISAITLRERLEKWGVERALSTPKMR